MDPAWRQTLIEQGKALLAADTDAMSRMARAGLGALDKDRADEVSAEMRDKRTTITGSRTGAGKRKRRPGGSRAIR
ncbi:MAG: hypothetical protein ACYSUX_19140 [Planctomycetota bacterium]